MFDLHETVRLLEDTNGIPAGSEGTVVFVHDADDPEDKHYEVEFDDPNGDFVFFAVPAGVLEPIELPAKRAAG